MKTPTSNTKPISLTLPKQPIAKMEWINFKSNPPYDAFADDQAGLEVDFTYAWFIYRRPNKPRLRNQVFLSFRACKFYNGLFEGYESRMGASPYPEDLIEIGAWAEDCDVQKMITTDYKNTLTT